METLKFTKEDLEFVRSRISGKQREYDIIQGRYDSAMEQLVKLGYKDWESAKAGLEELKQKREKLTRNLNDSWTEFIKKWEDVLEIEDT